jgi:hypothetical protein
MGWSAARNRPKVGAGNSWSGIDSLGWEAAVKVYGVAVAMPQGSSRMPNSSTEQQ